MAIVMSVHDFTFIPKTNKQGVSPEPAPIIETKLPQLPEVNKEDNIFTDKVNLHVEDVRSILPIGFRTMDHGMKTFFSDIQVPTKDEVRPLEVRVSGGDKHFLFLKQDLQSGRIKLPVMGINRTTVTFNPMKFSPPYLPMRRRFATNNGDRMVLTFRPWPALIEYVCSIWTERKRDMEYIIWQIATRFNSLAEFTVEDEFLRGKVQVRFGDIIDNSDIDIAADEFAKVKYDVSMTAEGWLPLPEKIVPTILGKVTALNEFSGQLLQAEISGGETIIANC